MNADLILFNGQFHTVDRENPRATAVAIHQGRFVAVGTDGEAMALRGSGTQVIDLKGRTVIPGLNDSHLHLIRGGLNYNLELRWEGVPSLADALRMLKDQADRTPTPQWVRVVGGWNEFQFAEKRMPTLDELNQAAPDTPVFVLHLYDRALLNRAALRVAGYTKDTPNPPGGEIVRDHNGNPTGMLVARPNAMILYATLAKGPKLPLEYQVNSTRQFMRELNRLGLTSAIDAGRQWPGTLTTGDQSGSTGTLGGAKSSKSPAPYTTLPPTTVSTDSIHLMASSSTLKKSADSAATSASWPTLIWPFLPCSEENQALPWVNSSRAVSRGSPSACSSSPPTVRPLTIQYSEVQGL